MTIRAYAKHRGAIQIMFAASACIDSIEGQPGFDLAESEDELFELVDSRRDSPDFYAAMRGGAK